MKALTPYLNFDGNAAEAMKFYADTLGADLKIQTYKDAGMEAAPGAENRVVHGHLSKGTAWLMASDTQPGQPFNQGNNCYVTVECESREEIERVFKAFSDGAKVEMELQDTFWGARFGMLRDRFGVGWMFNLQTGKTE